MPQLQSWTSFSSFIQDTVDIKLPQGYALVFQQKGMLHAGLGNNMKIVDYVTFPSPLIALCIGPFLREALGMGGHVPLWPEPILCISVSLYLG